MAAPEIRPTLSTPPYRVLEVAAGSGWRHRDGPSRVKRRRFRRGSLG
uniref:Uncharacterized protein n=1 Tax=Arundo donax TaxID=35708 RepID=A0A0A9A2N2_ARUDO